MDFQLKKMMPFMAIAFAVLTMVGCDSSTVANGECALIPAGVATSDGSRRAELLNAFKFAQLEDELTKLHKKNMSSEGGDLLTLRDLDDLQHQASRSENIVRMWIDQRPTSFFAQLFAGMFYEDKAQSARGHGYAASVRPEQLQSMKKYSEQANAHLQKAISLDPKSALPHAFLIVLSGRGEPVGGRTALQWQEAANQVDPKNMAARIQSMNYLSPRWSGSFEILDKVAADADKSLSSATGHYLKYNVVMAKASHYEVIEKDKAKALALYKQAQEMCSNSETARAGMLRVY